MKKTPDGYAPAPGYLEKQMEAMPELSHPEMPVYTIHEYNPLLDSSNMTPEDWWKIAQDIAANYENYDGFVVLHGTDTMAYTASALPFMLQGLQKPVIITGSQIPLCEIRNDARANLITSLMIATMENPYHEQHAAIPEVCLYFGNKLLRGCRAVKVDADGLEAFDSPNFPVLGTAGVHITIHWKRILDSSGKSPTLMIRKFADPVVGTLRLFPGISTELIKNILQPPLKGLVIEAYGVGNAPDNNAQFLDVLQDAVIKHQIVLVDCTQCLKGRVDLNSYVTGSKLAKAGVISGFDMTAEAALAKLFYLFSVGYSLDEIKKKVQENLCGELTVQ